MCSLDDDIVLDLFAYLDVPAILALRQCSWRFYRLSTCRIVWHHAYINHSPLRSDPPPTLDTPELERRARRAYRLSVKWRSPRASPEKMLIFDATSTTSVSDLRFLPGHDAARLLTVSKGIWSLMTVWDVADGLRKLAQWGPKGVLFNGFAVNARESEATLAVSVFEEG
jgi:hypothetical protein